MNDQQLLLFEFIRLKTISFPNDWQDIGVFLELLNVFEVIIVLGPSIKEVHDQVYSHILHLHLLADPIDVIFLCFINQSEFIYMLHQLFYVKQETNITLASRCFTIYFYHSVISMSFPYPSESMKLSLHSYPSIYPPTEYSSNLSVPSLKYNPGSLALPLEPTPGVT